MRAVTEGDLSRQIEVTGPGDILGNILDLSKIEAGKVDLNIEPVAIARLLKNLEHRFEPLASEKKLELRIAVDPGCPGTIETDLQRVQQILTNLLSNALKFTENGSIQLRAVPHDARRIAFTVEDTGIGMSAATACARRRPF
jgi:signal transduction histidine kinase